MPNITSLRERAIALVERRRQIGRALERLDAVSVTLTPAMMQHTAPKSFDEDDEEDDERMRGDEGKAYPLFSTQALLAIVGHGDFTDRQSRTFASNSAYYERELNQVASNLPEIDRGAEPDLSDLTRFEVVALVEAYKAVISNSTRILMEANEPITRLRSERSRMPGYVRGACIGMFGQPDHPTAHRYDEGDFATYNKREEPILAGEPGYMEGRRLTRLVDLHPVVFSSRYLSPILGEAIADEVEPALSAIEDAARPRPGEAPVPRFQSHQDRKPIEIAYETGEIDINEPGFSGPGYR